MKEFWNEIKKRNTISMILAKVIFGWLGYNIAEQLLKCFKASKNVVLFVEIFAMIIGFEVAERLVLWAIRRKAEANVEESEQEPKEEQVTEKDSESEAEDEQTTEED